MWLTSTTSLLILKGIQPLDSLGAIWNSPLMTWDRSHMMLADAGLMNCYHPFSDWVTHLTLINKPHDKNSSADATWMESIIPAQILSTVRPSFNNQTHSVQKAVKAAQWPLYRNVYQSHMCSASKLETLASYLWPDFCSIYSRLEEKKKNKWWVSLWRHSLKESSKQRCLWKCGWNGALKSSSLFAQIHHTHEETFSVPRIHAGHVESSLIAARLGQAQWCKRSYLNCMGSIVVLDIPLRLSLISAD